MFGCMLTRPLQHSILLFRNVNLSPEKQFALAKVNLPFDLVTAGLP